MIHYVRHSTALTYVYDSGKRVGEIRQVEGGFQYLPGGKKRNAGPVYVSMQTLKDDLEGTGDGA